MFKLVFYHLLSKIASIYDDMNHYVSIVSVMLLMDPSICLVPTYVCVCCMWCVMCLVWVWWRIWHGVDVCSKMVCVVCVVSV